MGRLPGTGIRRRLTSGGYGYTVDKSIGYGYVRNQAGVDRAYLRAGSYELKVASQ